MADVSIPQVANIQPVAAGIRPVQTTTGFGSMSLGDIVNMASNMQTYQKQKELLPYEIEAGKAESQRRQLEAQKAGIDLNMHNANISRGVFGGFLSDPDFINGNSEQMIKKLTQSRDFLHSVGVRSPDEGKMFNDLLEEAKSNPQAAYQTIKNGVQQAGGAQAQYQTQQQFQPTQLYQGGGQPQPGAPAPQGGQGGAPAQGGQAQAQSAGMNLPFPVRNPNQPYAPFPQEAAAVQAGEKYYKDLSDFGVNTVKYKRDIDEVIKQADILEKSALPTSGIAGAIHRKVATALGDPQYVQLSKDLANVQIAALKASGGDMESDAGKKLQAAANGDVTYPPEILKNIAERAKADVTQVNMQRQAADKFYRKFGANNMSAFKQEWANNADSRVFQAMNIYQGTKDKEKANAEVANVLGIPADPKDWDEKDKKISDEFLTKYRNIKTLVNTGGL